MAAAIGHAASEQAAARGRPHVLTHPHPPDTSGPYAVPSRLRRFVTARAPRCEWPGCGVRASRCDLDHDLAHPDGPTCSCNLGPLCRRHHQIKQLGWTKHRTERGVSITSPTLRTTLSPTQHPPVPAVRGARHAGVSSQLSQSELEDALHPSDPRLASRDHHGTGDWVLAARDAERRWWDGQLAALRDHAAA